MPFPALLAACLLWGGDASAAELVVLGPSRASAAAAGAQPVALPELRWLVVAPRDIWGATIEFSSGPFLHSQHPQYAAECRLTLRVLQAHRAAEWTVVTAVDQTRGTARESATVVAASRDRGSAILGLQATFVPTPGEPLCAGEYVTRVVGLVSGW